MIDLITDRTESDTLLKNEKGVYGYAGLNRVETAVSEISALFPILDIGLDLKIKTDWGLPGAFSVADWPTASQMQRYLGNISAIKSAFGLGITIPLSMANLTWTGANNIEKALQIAMKRASGTIESFRYSGEIYSGEE